MIPINYHHKNLGSFEVHVANQEHKNLCSCELKRLSTRVHEIVLCKFVLMRIYCMRHACARRDVTTKRERKKFPHKISNFLVLLCKAPRDFPKNFFSSSTFPFVHPQMKNFPCLWLRIAHIKIERQTNIYLGNLN